MELLSKIKIKVPARDATRAKCPSPLLAETMMRVLSIEQVESEGPLDHVKQLKQSGDITKSQMGADVLSKFVKNTHEHQEEADDAKKKELKDRRTTQQMGGAVVDRQQQSKQVRFSVEQTHVTTLNG